MKRLIISTIGVILTFIWIIYTAPPKSDKIEDFDTLPIKKINRSGGIPNSKIRQPAEKKISAVHPEYGNYVFLNP